MREECDSAKHRFVVMAVVVVASILLPCARGGTVYSYGDLVGQMTDLERLALLPDPGEQGALFSSYDRRSRYDETKDGYEAWDCNDDSHGVVRAEGDQLVLAEMQGPGVLWRMWAATVRSGHVRIFLDDADQPAVDLPFEDYFGYAWGLAERFARSYHAQPLNDNNTGHISNVRWQIMDNVPFHQSFDGYLEHWTGGQPNLRGTLFAATVYWYLASDGTDPIPAVPLEQRFGYWPRPPGEQQQKP